MLSRLMSIIWMTCTIYMLGTSRTLSSGLLHVTKSLLVLPSPVFKYILLQVPSFYFIFPRSLQNKDFLYLCSITGILVVFSIRRGMFLSHICMKQFMFLLSTAAIINKAGNSPQFRRLQLHRLVASLSISYLCCFYSGHTFKKRFHRFDDRNSHSWT